MAIASAMVECSFATRAIRIRFPIDATPLGSIRSSVIGPYANTGHSIMTDSAFKVTYKVSRNLWKAVKFHLLNIAEAISILNCMSFWFIMILQCSLHQNGKLSEILINYLHWAFHALILRWLRDLKQKNR